ncbi:hypothetical protein KUTeg_010039 [Tegillarca granosa]|uniref:PDZ domain-containing protein n=1 Tax=Tegillarca granosa TaxID=220873 RepID=A0ABQ9F5L9_TEGGR|nr:hypothetical protein KUTeg_010039 [Tegillarca granosa]
MDNQRPNKFSLSNLKQMSVKRQSLEKSSEELTANLEELQKVNEEQELRIKDTLTELQKQQQMAEELLQSDDGTGRRKLQREPTMIRQLRQWTTADVIRWLENTKLHKFILLFQRHHVSGADLADINLPFLEGYDHISVEDKEILLAEVYELLRLESPEENNSSHEMTSVEKEKYLAAVQLTKDKELYQRSNSMPYVVLSPQQNASDSSPSSQTMSPTAKLRKRSSESDTSIRWSNTTPKKELSTESKIQKENANVIKSKQSDKMTTENIQSEWTSQGTSNIYRSLEGKTGQHHIHCTQLHKHSDTGQFGVTLDVNTDGHIIISQTDGQRQVPSLQIGDRLLEVNGYNMTCFDGSSLDLVRNIMEESNILQLVTVRTVNNINGVQSTRGGNSLSEEFKWNQLRKLLVNMKNQDVDPEMDSVPVNDLQDMKDRCTLLSEIKELQRSISEQQEKIRNLESDLESRKTDVEDLQMQRDRALNIRTKSNDSNRQGETTYYKITMETLDVQSASKEQVVELLKEIVKEASKQKFYLDRLISVVVDEVPWILEQVDADFDDMSLGNQPEEFC